MKNFLLGFITALVLISPFAVYFFHKADVDKNNARAMGRIEEACDIMRFLKQYFPQQQEGEFVDKIGVKVNWIIIKKTKDGVFLVEVD